MTKFVMAALLALTFGVTGVALAEADRGGDVGPSSDASDQRPGGDVRDPACENVVNVPCS